MQLTHLMHTQLHLMMTRHAARYWPITKRTSSKSRLVSDTFCSCKRQLRHGDQGDNRVLL